MNYEKKYKEALDTAKYWAVEKPECAGLLGGIFPELKESEDERIRKAALKGIEYLEHELCWDAIGDIDILSVKSYLEKQKVNTEGDFARGYDCGYECCLHSHGAEWFEKQKEKVVKFDHLKQQKPVQSDEEREYVRILKSLISDFIRDNYKTTDITFYQQIYDWLDGRHIEQKPQIEICPHSIKSKSYNENGYPIENCDYGLEIAETILEETLGKVEGYQSDDGIREHQTAIQAVKDAMKEQKPAQTEEEREYIKTLKGLVSDFVRDCGGGITDIGYYQRICDWLDERHVEQKPAECGCTNDESEYDKGYREGHKFGLKETQEYMLPEGRTFSGLIPCWVNAPSELQPAHKYHGKNAVIMHENNGGFMCCFIDDKKATTVHLPENTFFVEGWRKKPAEWSEDLDEEIKRFYEECIVIHEAKVYGRTERVMEVENYEIIARHFAQWQKEQQQEWSEEDKKYLDYIIKYITHYDFNQDEMGTLEEYNNLHNGAVSFLKSLRPQPKRDGGVDYNKGYLKGRADTLKEFNDLADSWKPSKEQMSMLRALVNDPNNVGAESCHLAMESLYEQLKKLCND